MRKYKTFFWAYVGCILLLALPLLAQSILPPPLQRSHTASSPLSSGDATAEEPRITVFEDWVHRCTDLTIEDKAITQCELLQAQQKPQGDKMLNVLILAFAEIVADGQNAKTAFMLTSVVPLDVFLPEGMRFLADGREVMHVPFRNCNLNGCWSQMVVEEGTLNALKKGVEGLARFTIISGQEVEVKFSLKGLTSGLNALHQGQSK